LVEPLEHRFWTTLELQVAVLSGSRALDPLGLLVGHWDVFVHRLNVARVGDAVVANLVEECRHVDVFGPLLWDSLGKPDAGVQADQGVEIVEAVAEAKQGQPALDDVPGVTGCGDSRQRTPSNASGKRVIAAKYTG
jgi:hypothetical protein